MKLAQFLEKKRISLKVFGGLVGVTKQTIYKIKKLGHIPSLPIAHRIFKASDGEVTLKDLGYFFLDGQWIKPNAYKTYKTKTQVQSKKM